MVKKTSDYDGVSIEGFEENFEAELVELFVQNYFSVTENILFPSEPPDAIEISDLKKHFKSHPIEPLEKHFITKKFIFHDTIYSAPGSLLDEDPDYFDNYIQYIDRINKKAIILGLPEQFIPTDDSKIRVAIALFKDTLEKFIPEENHHIIMRTFITLLPGMQNYNLMTQLIDRDNERLKSVKDAIVTLINYNVVGEDLHARKDFWFMILELIIYRNIWTKYNKKYKPFQPALILLVQNLNDIDMKNSMRAMLYEIFEDSKLLGVLFKDKIQKYAKPKIRKDKILEEITNLITYSKKQSNTKILLSFSHF